MNKRALLTAGVVASFLILANILTTNRSTSLSAASAPPASVTPSPASDDFLPVESIRWDCAYGRSGNGDCNSNGWEVVINEEHFGTSATNWWNRNQTIVGYTTDGNRLLLAVTNGAVNPQGVHWMDR